VSDIYTELRQLVERYADAVCRRDAAAWGGTWAPDGVWDLGRGKAEGREQVVAFWKQAMSGFPMAIQIIHNGVVLSHDGDAATARWYLSEYLHTADGGRRLGVGVYHDTYRRIDGRWHFALRKYNLLYSGAPDLSGEALPFPSDG
jgi:uncharacterized protein (TIGR02246 family)